MDNIASKHRRANDYKASHTGTKAAVNASLTGSKQNSDQTEDSLRRDESQGGMFVLQNNVNLQTFPADVRETHLGAKISSKLSKANRKLEKINKFLQNQEITDAVRGSVEATISKLEESFRKTKGILRRNEKGVEAENVVETQLSMDCCATGSNDSPSKDGNQNNVGDLQSNALFYQLSSEVSKMRNDIDLLKKKVDEIEDLKSEIKQIKSMVNFQEVRSGASEKSSSTETNKFRQTLDSKTTNAPEKVGFSVKNVFSKHNLLKSSNENAGKKHFKEHSTSGNNRESPAEDQPMTRYPNNVDADFYSTEGTPSASFTSWRPSLHKSSNEDTRKKHSMPGDHREPPAEDPSIIHYPNIIDTGLYSTEATPSALSTSVDNVKNRLYRYAKEVQIFGIRRKLKLDYSTVGNEGISNYLMRYSGPKTLLLGKCVIEALVSEQIFQNFELRSFGGITQGLFQKPDDFKMLRLHIYKNYKEEEPKTMYDQIPAFKDFVNRKLLEVRNLITCRLFTESNEIEDGEREHLFDERFEPFLKLSKEVWLLHTLAFGCQPASAEIFRVPAGSSYMAQYMKEKEDIRGPLDSRQAANRKVACMTVPGFTLRSSIIPADVCCYDSLTSGL